VPPDYDNDTTSNLNDPDDDNDTQPDTSDPFAIDEDNGKTTNLPVNYTWDNDAIPPGGLLNLGFTGLMTNKVSDYETLYDPQNMTAGGAAGATTIDKIPAGDAFKAVNTQKYGLQFGVNATANTGVFTAHTKINGPFAGITPQNSQAMGLSLGNGDQDNYVKLTTHANGGAGGIEFAKEVGGAFSTRRNATEPMPGPDAVDLYLTVNPSANTVQPSYQVTKNGVVGPRNALGSPVSVPAGWFGGANGLAVGIISTSAGPGPEFPATWDFIEVVPDGGTVDTVKPTVEGVVPVENATGVAPAANISASFSEAMRASSVNANNFRLFKTGISTKLPATVTYDAANKKAILNPSADLQPGATYKAVAGVGMKDVAGNSLASNKVWFFTVGG
jgi:hypothetical protein